MWTVHVASLNPSTVFLTAHMHWVLRIYRNCIYIYIYRTCEYRSATEVNQNPTRIQTEDAHNTFYTFCTFCTLAQTQQVWNGVKYLQCMWLSLGEPTSVWYGIDHVILLVQLTLIFPVSYMHIHLYTFSFLSAFSQYNMEQFTPAKVNDDTVINMYHYVECTCINWNCVVLYTYIYVNVVFMLTCLCVY